MHRPIKATSVLWMTATLLLAVVPSSSTAEILTQNNNRGSSSSLHKTWGKFIQRQSLISKLEPSSSTSATLSNDTHRRCITSGGRLSKLPCFVRRLPPTTTQQSKSTTTQSMVDIEWSLATGQIITKIRGGAAADDDEYDTTDDESDEDEYDSEYEDEYDSEYDDETDNEEESSEQQTSEQQDDKIVSSLTSSSLQSSLRSKSSTTTNNNEEQQIQKYDDVLAPPAMQQLVISLGVMFLSQKIDILDTKTVRIARFAFVAYVVIMQMFLVYVRLRAKAIDDRTEITLSNPLATLVQGAAGGAAGVGGGGGNFMVKALTDQMLSSTTTIYEYDIAQAKKMNSGLLLPMVFLYFLHFKMKQVQPLLMQTATGVMNMIYSPLFQVYVLGRNLERPFKSPPGGNSVLDALQQGEEEDLEESSSGSGDDGEKGVDDDVVEEEDDVDDEEEESEESEGESDEGEEESDGDESEYDTDEE
mmetsp:Transcript_26062/g.40942  ORF Transcript_26062/g.40942 Transcript_26062/m.40942 type:complete len:473 (+) Transcript_26062:74-1492(+)